MARQSLAPFTIGVAAAALLLCSHCTAAAPELPTVAKLPVTGAGSACQGPLSDMAAVQTAWRSVAGAVQDGLLDPACISLARTYVPGPPSNPASNPGPLLACLKPYADVRGAGPSPAMRTRSRQGYRRQLLRQPPVHALPQPLTLPASTPSMTGDGPRVC